MADEINHDELIAQYTSVTGGSAEEARQYLETFDWNINAAVEDHYARNQGSDQDPDYAEDSEDAAETAPGEGRRLGGGSIQQAAASTTAASSRPKTNAAPRKKFATLGDFSSSATKDESDSDDNQDLFAGGEKSGLAVQNPDDLKKRILEKAQKAGGRPPKDEPEKKSNFAGPARTLGGEDEPSREIAAEPQSQPRQERVSRILHFWRDGFSVDDGDLYRANDPQNADILNFIRQGRAPLHIMNVQPGQEVDVEIKQHDEDYVKPKKKYKPFEGHGNRLGSPTPGSGSTTMPGAFTSDTTSSAATVSTPPPPAEVDESKPTVTLRVSLASGTRLTSRFNTNATIGDVYAFVQQAETGSRQFVLQTTFPTTDLTDKAKVLGDMPEFKRGGAVVQKYV